MLILASGSAARRALLAAAGIEFTIVSPLADEEAIKASLRAQAMTPGEQARVLAEEKALSVSRTREGLVIGADQMLALDGEAFDKPVDLGAARRQLQRLRGRTHVLCTALAVAQGDRVIWRCFDEPKLTMRAFSDAFLERYLTEVDEAALRSAGGYQIEGLGAQLFERVEGDHFSIMGLPLLPLLHFLRMHGALSS